METKKLKDLSFEALCGIIAKVIHSANVAYVDSIGGRTVNPSWEEVREEQRSGLIKAVAGTIVNPLSPQITHEKWCLAREKEGWTKDIKYDYNRKTHPNMVPFDQLPLEEQFKDHLYMGIASIFCGGFGILDMPEVQAARRILQAEFAIQHPQIEAPEEEVKPDDVDPATTEALMEKLAEAKEKLATAEADKEAAQNGEQDGELAAVKAAAAENGTGPDGKPIDPDQPSNPLPDEQTAEDLAKDAVGVDKVGILDGVGSGDTLLPTAHAPRPNIPDEEIKTANNGFDEDKDWTKDTPAEPEDGANDTPAEDQGDKQDKDSPVKTSDVQESTANGAGKSKPKGKATVEDGKKVEKAKHTVKKPAKKRSGK